MTTRASVVPVAPWAGVALVLLFALHDRFDVVQTRVLIPLCLVVAALGLLHRRRDALSLARRSPDARALRRRTLFAVALLGATSLGLVLLRAVVASKLGLRFDLLSALVPPLLGWTIFLLLPIGLAPARGARAWEPALPGSIVISLLAFVAVGLATFARTHFDNIDEVLYTLQAHRFALGHATWRLDPELQRFVKLPMMAVTPDHIHTLFPPGYPAVLALFVRLGIPSLCAATIGAVAAFATYRLGRRVAGARSVGLVAALLLATNPVVIRWTAANLSHAAAMTALCIAAFLLLDATERADRQRDVESVAAGFLLGVAFTVRPVTALAVGLSIWLALLMRRLGWPRLRRVTALLCVGAAFPFAVMLTYNAATNGSALRLGYQVALGHLSDMGFGERGVIVYDRDVRPVVSAAPFGFADAVHNEISVAWPLARDLFPVWWLLPLLAVTLVYRVRVRWAVAIAFSVLPIVNFFYFGNAERLYVELLPFVFVAVALLLRQVASVDVRAARALLVFLVGANVVTSATHIAGDRWMRLHRPIPSERLARALRDSSRAAPNILVFVRDTTLAEPLFIGLSQFNLGRFPGPVVVARDLRAENAQLACRLPGYRVLVAELAPPPAADGARLVSWNDGSLVASRCDRPPLVSTLPPSG